MGCYDDAEVCELVEIYLWSILANVIDKNNSGLYRKYGLIHLRNVNGQKVDPARKNVKKFSKNLVLK